MSPSFQNGYAKIAGKLGDSNCNVPQATPEVQYSFLAAAN